MKQWAIWGMGFSLVAAAGCHTVSVPTISADVTSEPARAVLIVNGHFAGITPLQVNLPQVTQSNVLNVLVAVYHRHDFGIRVLDDRISGNNNSTSQPLSIHFDMPLEAKRSGINWAGDTDILLGISPPRLTQFTSTPPGATIVINNAIIGVTPCSSKIPSLNRDIDDVHTVIALKDGFNPSARLFSKKYIDDRLYSLIPAHMHFDLKPSIQHTHAQANPSSASD